MGRPNPSSLPRSLGWWSLATPPRWEVDPRPGLPLAIGLPGSGWPGRICLRYAPGALGLARC